MEYTVNHYPEKHRFEVVEDGLTAYVEYRLRGDALDIIHTIVPKNLEGRGIAATLVETAYKYAKEQGLRPLATCSYAVVWLKRHPEFSSLIVIPNILAMSSACKEVTVAPFNSPPGIEPIRIPAISEEVRSISFKEVR